MSTHDALILGGGPAGATAGIILAKAGWRVAIVEKAAFPRRKVCGEFISATSLPILFELGVGDEFLSLAGPEVHRVGLFEGETCLQAPMPRTSKQGGWGRALGREHLDLLLLSAAKRAGAQVWQPWKATGLERRDGGWVCAIAGEDAHREVSARLVIAANGSWERGPLAIPGSDAHRDSDLLAFKAHFQDADLGADLMPLLVFPGGYGGMVHSDAGRTSLSCCIRRDRLQACRPQGRAAQAVLQHIQNSCGGVRQALRQARLDGAWLSAGPIQPGIRHCYQDGVFFTGNIAGEAHPIVAEGISMAMQSSWLLCRGLIASADDMLATRGLVEIGNLYTAEWRKAFSLRIHAAALFAHLAMRPAAAKAFLPVLERYPQVLTFGARLAGKARPLPGARAFDASAPAGTLTDDQIPDGDPGRNEISQENR